MNNTVTSTPSEIANAAVSTLRGRAQMMSDAYGRACFRFHSTGRSYCRFNASVDVSIEPHKQGGLVAIVQPLVGSTSATFATLRTPTAQAIVEAIDRRCRCSICA